MNKLLLILLSVLCLFSTSQAADLIQENDKGQLAARLDKVKLAELTKFIENKYSIKFKGQNSQLQTPITASFQKLNVEQMLKKILTGMNYVFTYDKSGKVTEVTLLPTSQKNTGAMGHEDIAKNQQPQLPIATPQVDNAPQGENAPQGGNGGPQAIAQLPAARNSGSDPITSFKVQQNASPPGKEQGSKRKNGPDEITSFKVIRNAPPPGN